MAAEEAPRKRKRRSGGMRVSLDQKSLRRRLPPDTNLAMDFANKKCVPCEGGIPKMTPDEVAKAQKALRGWDSRLESSQLHKHFRFRDFKAAMRFVNALADLAEAEGHHPDFTLHSWNVVDVMLSTHAVGGLSENDFILAAKIDRLPEGEGAF
jgi:4a-hydroxytetrahydrobiopterin dehydratase